MASVTTSGETSSQAFTGFDKLLMNFLLLNTRVILVTMVVISISLSTRKFHLLWVGAKSVSNVIPTRQDCPFELPMNYSYDPIQSGHLFGLILPRPCPPVKPPQNVFIKRVTAFAPPAPLSPGGSLGKAALPLRTPGRARPPDAPPPPSGKRRARRFTSPPHGSICPWWRTSVRRSARGA